MRDINSLRVLICTTIYFKLRRLKALVDFGSLHRTGRITASLSKALQIIKSIANQSASKSSRNLRVMVRK